MESHCLVLTVVKYKGNPSVEESIVRFEGRGGKIGRTEDNDLVLSKDDYVSRHHAEIRYESGCYLLTDTSENGTQIENGNSLHHDTIQLTDSSHLRIGDYEILVNIDGPEPDFGSESDKTHIEIPIQKSALDKLQPAESDELDPFRQIDNKLINNHSAPSIEPGLDHAPPQNLVYEPRKLELPEERDEAVPTNLEEQLFPNFVQPEDKYPSSSDRGKDAAAIEESDFVGREDLKQKVAQKEKVEESPRNEPATDALVEAFLEGAGLPGTYIMKEDPVKSIRLAGMLMREMIEGMMKLLHGRAEAKIEIGAPGTIIRRTENNPLKFSASVDAALKSLLSREAPEYLAPLDAVKDGYEDIMNHQLAMATGFEAVLKKSLTKFDPRHVEERYKERWVFNKKAKFWNDYSSSYRGNVERANEELFGETFVRAYEEKMRLLRSMPYKD